MATRTIALTVSLCSVLLASILLVVVTLGKSKRFKGEPLSLRVDSHRVYLVCMSMPVFGSRLKQIFDSLGRVSPNSEKAKEIKAVQYWGVGLAVFFGILCLMFEFMPNWSMRIGACVLAYWLFEQVLEFTLVRQQVLLLKDLIAFIGDVRTFYFDTWMVDDSIYLALQNLKTNRRTGMLAQGGMLLEMLESPNEAALEVYSGQAPNHYLKLLASILFITREFGDAPSDQPSRFAKSLNLLQQEIREEVLWREQLSIALKSLNLVIVMPLFVLLPIRSWASTSFEVMKDFYSGPLGFVCENFVMGAVLLSTYLLRRIHHNEGDLVLATKKETKSNTRGIAMHLLFRIDKLIFKKSEGNLFEWWQNLSAHQQRIAGDWERRLKNTFYGVGLYLVLVVYAIVSFRPFLLRSPPGATGVNSSAFINLAIGLGVVIALCCWISDILYEKFSRYLNQLESESEVNRFHTVILAIMHVPQLGVDDILQWLEKFSNTYRSPLQKAILDFDSGALKALDSLVAHSKTSDFNRIVTQLMMAVESLPISKAFEELEAEKTYFQEKRKAAQQRFVSKKIGLGQIVGFIPTYMILIVYFTLPMIYASVNEMQRYIDVLM